jgi:hypothetical protein
MNAPTANDRIVSSETHTCALALTEALGERLESEDARQEFFGIAFETIRAAILRAQLQLLREWWWMNPRG